MNHKDLLQLLYTEKGQPQYQLYRIQKEKIIFLAKKV